MALSLAKQAATNCKMLAMTVILALLLLAIVFGPRMKRFLRQLAVPGPLLPRGIKGNLVDFMDEPRKFGPRMVAQHGPLYRVYNNNFGTLMAVADPVLAQQLFQQQANMAHPWDLGLGHFLQRFLAESMGLASGRKWSNIRKAFRVPMATSAADASLANIEASLDQWEQDTLEPLASSGQVVRLQEVVGTMPIDIMLKIFFGHQFVSNYREKFLSVSEDAEAIMTTVMHNKLACTAVFRFLSTTQNQTLKRFQRNWADILLAYETSQERVEGDGGAFDAVVDVMTTTMKEGITIEEVADTMAEIIFTNQDVLNPAITWMLADLMVYPHIVDSLGLSGVREMMDKATLEADFPQLLHLIKESARVHPFFPLSMPEMLGKDLQLGGFLLPKGTSLSIDQYSLNHHSKYWTDPTKFQPERFETLDDFTAKWGLFRFGFGARRCPGQYYGNLVMANVTARLLSRWRLEPVGMEGVAHHEEVPVVPGNFAMLPDIKVCIQGKEGAQEGDDSRNTENSSEKMKDEDNKENHDSKENEGTEKEMWTNKNKTSNGPLRADDEIIINGDDNQLLDSALEIIRPIFRPGSSLSCLASPGVMVGVSVLPSHPILSTAGSNRLVSFLAALPHPSIVFVADSLNRHNVKAMCRNANKPPSEEKALAAALEAGEPFFRFLGEAIQQLEMAKPDKKGWVTLLCWDAVTENEEMRQLQVIIRCYYENASSSLRARVDQIATDFLQYRRPQSKNHAARLPHMVAYILGELPPLLMGIEHRGQRFTTLLYPTAVSKVSGGRGSCLANTLWDLTHDIHTKQQFADLRQELTAAAGGREVIPGVPLLPMELEEEQEVKKVLSSKSSAAEKKPSPESFTGEEVKTVTARALLRQTSAGR
jgi:cytochrome P450